MAHDAVRPLLHIETEEIPLRLAPDVPNAHTPEQLVGPGSLAGAELGPVEAGTVGCLEEEAVLVHGGGVVHQRDELSLLTALHRHGVLERLLPPHQALPLGGQLHVRLVYELEIPRLCAPLIARPDGHPVCIEQPEKHRLALEAQSLLRGVEQRYQRVCLLARPLGEDPERVFVAHGEPLRPQAHLIIRVLQEKGRVSPVVIRVRLLLLCLLGGGGHCEQAQPCGDDAWKDPH
mmetsp:Transcript_16494/g.36538  ORF Transcript_16494/g.36538 Transcript_16494/m.36538 type:complete len:233 (+) Transcript_16494:404-1102(+)